jgi:hypothetical protein
MFNLEFRNFDPHHRACRKQIGVFKQRGSELQMKALTLCQQAQSYISEEEQLCTQALVSENGLKPELYARAAVPGTMALDLIDESSGLELLANSCIRIADRLTTEGNWSGLW